MRLSYKNNIEDLIKFNTIILKNHPTYKKVVSTLRFTVPIITMIISCAVYTDGSQNSNMFFLFFSSLSVIWLIFFPTMYFRGSKRAIAKNFYKHHNTSNYETLILDEKGITKELDGEVNSISWSKIKNVEVTDTHIYIYIEDSRGAIIPLDVFSDLTEKELFLQFIKDHIG